LCETQCLIVSTVQIWSFTLEGSSSVKSL
jgi:hypothetical protein